MPPPSKIFSPMPYQWRQPVETQNFASPEEVSAKHTDAIRSALIAIFARETQDFASLLLATSGIKHKSSSCHYNGVSL